MNGIHTWILFHKFFALSRTVPSILSHLVPAKMEELQRLYFSMHCLNFAHQFLNENVSRLQTRINHISTKRLPGPVLSRVLLVDDAINWRSAHLRSVRLLRLRMDGPDCGPAVSRHVNLGNHFNMVTLGEV